MADDKTWWFAKREDGLGWGLPTCWQGWLTLCVYTISMIAGLALATAKLGPMIGGGLTVGFLGVLVVKGEPQSTKPGRQENPPE